MTPGNVEFVDVICSMAVWTGGTAAILSVDERRLRAEALARAWLPATRDAAVLGAFLFSALYSGPALVVHFVRTRRSFLGAGLGLGMVAALLAADFAVQSGAEAIIEWLSL